MSLQTYTIEIKLDADHDDAHDAMKELVREAARGMFAAAAMLQSRRTPQIICRTDDEFFTSTDIGILD